MNKSGAEEQHRIHVQQLFVKNQGVLKGYVLGLVPEFASAEDVLQEVFLTVTAKANQFEEGSNFVAWARSIARFKVMAHWRARRGEPQALSNEVLESLAASAPEVEPEEQTERERALKGCLAKLSPTVRELVELRYAQEHKPAEIARIKNWTPEAVYVALSRARAALRACLQKQLALSGKDLI